MADKSNAMHARPRAVAARVQGTGAAVSRTSRRRICYIDALAMFLVQSPGQFEVIVTNNLFGDIITDIGGALQGGLGMAASGNIHPGRTSMFEPVHGSAPPLAGKNVANPIGAILSAALMLETLGRADDARRIERAVEAGRARRRDDARYRRLARHEGSGRRDLKKTGADLPGRKDSAST